MAIVLELARVDVLRDSGCTAMRGHCVWFGRRSDTWEKQMTTDDETLNAWMEYLCSPVGTENTIFNGFAAGRASLQPLIDSLTARIEAQAELLRARAEKPGV